MLLTSSPLLLDLTDHLPLLGSHQPIRRGDLVLESPSASQTDVLALSAPKPDPRQSDELLLPATPGAIFQPAADEQAAALKPPSASPRFKRPRSASLAPSSFPESLLNPFAAASAITFALPPLRKTLVSAGDLAPSASFPSLSSLQDSVARFPSATAEVECSATDSSSAQSRFNELFKPKEGASYVLKSRAVRSAQALTSLEPAWSSTESEAPPVRQRTHRKSAPKSLSLASIMALQREQKALAAISQPDYHPLSLAEVKEAIARYRKSAAKFLHTPPFPEDLRQMVVTFYYQSLQDASCASRTRFATALRLPATTFIKWLPAYDAGELKKSQPRHPD